MVEEVNWEDFLSSRRKQGSQPLQCEPSAHLPSRAGKPEAHQPPLKMEMSKVAPIALGASKKWLLQPLPHDP